jgi:hypothetical protein
MASTQYKIKEAIDNANDWINFLATKSDKDLERRLEINYLQYETAYKDKAQSVCELLEVMRRILIEARIYKDEHSIADQPTAIDVAIEENRIINKQLEARKNILAEGEVENEIENNTIPSRNFKIKSHRINEVDESQMRLF